MKSYTAAETTTLDPYILLLMDLSNHTKGQVSLRLVYYLTFYCHNSCYLLSDLLDPCIGTKTIWTEGLVNPILWLV